MTWWAKVQAVTWIYVSKAFSKLAIKCDRWAEASYKRAAAIISKASAPPPS